jgi:hypothetical protein
MAAELNLHIETLKRPELWPIDWILHHDNVPTHKELSEFLAQNQISEIEHLPYDPNLAPNDFWLFPNTKGRRFHENGDNQKTTTEALKAIPQGEYFEGDPFQ